MFLVVVAAGVFLNRDFCAVRLPVCEIAQATSAQRRSQASDKMVRLRLAAG